MRDAESSLTSWENQKRTEARKRLEKANCAVELCKQHGKEQEANKSVRGMPRLSETTKDVVSCEKLRGGANDH